MARLATPIFPIMDNLFLDTFYFAVPYRLLWDSWVKMMGEQKNPGDSTSYICPYMYSFSVNAGNLFDYFGLPYGGIDAHVNTLPFRAYNLIYNEWFRDEEANMEFIMVITANVAFLHCGSTYRDRLIILYSIYLDGCL